MGTKPSDHTITKNTAPHTNLAFSLLLHRRGICLVFLLQPGLLAFVTFVANAHQEEYSEELLSRNYCLGENGAHIAQIDIQPPIHLNPVLFKQGKTQNGKKNRFHFSTCTGSSCHAARCYTCHPKKIFPFVHDANYFARMLAPRCCVFLQTRDPMSEKLQIHESNMQFADFSSEQGR